MAIVPAVGFDAVGMQFLCRQAGQEKESAMRRLIPLGLLVAIALPAIGAKRLTVAQLEQALTAASAAHKPDAEIAHLVAGMELSERLSDAGLERLDKQLNAGPQVALPLRLLADQSAFLDLPPGELLSIANPDDAAQQRMLQSARNYVAQSLPSLPNFLATRTINRYDDSPQALKKGGWPVRAGLHLVDTTSWEISVLNERENQPAAQSSAVWKAQIGLISGGEFGTTLGMILADTAQTKVAWSHWEQAEAGPAAVFRYSVPKSASHFEIVGNLQRQAVLEGHAMPMGNGRGVSGIGVQSSDIDASSLKTIRTRPGYHGSLWLDPATGTVLRITMEADSKDGAPFQRAAIQVQYGPVQIGDSKFICPVRSLALSLAAGSAALDPLNRTPAEGPTLWLNETLFTGYHRFAATTRILTDGTPAQPDNPSSEDSHAR
jgi:hypothetical protein